MSPWNILQSDKRRKRAEIWRYQYTYGLFKNILQKEKGSSYLHELHLPPIICLLNLTFTGPFWSLLHIPIHFERIDRHWKQSRGFDFSTSSSFLSNNEIVVHREKCAYTYTVKYFMYIHIHTGWM